MTQEYFGDREDAVQRLESSLPGWLASTASHKAELAKTLVDAFKASEESAAGDRRAVYSPRRWVIRDQDLALLDSLGPILQGTATGAALVLTTGTLTVGAIAPAAAILYQLFKTGMAMQRKGITLAPLDFKILCVLREHPAGLDVSAIMQHLPTAPEPPAEKVISARLEELAKYPTRDGNVELAWKSADHLWRSKGV